MNKIQSELKKKFILLDFIIETSLGFSTLCCYKQAIKEYPYIDIYYCSSTPWAQIMSERSLNEKELFHQLEAEKVYRIRLSR